MDAKYQIYHPDYPGFKWTKVSKDGKTDNVVLANIISSMRRGVYTQRAYNLRLVPDIENPKRKDCTTLGKLFACKKSSGSQIGLRKISEKNRFKGRDWEAERVRITEWADSGLSVSDMAKRIGVSQSTLSKANKRYGLYESKQFIPRKLPNPAHLTLDS